MSKSLKMYEALKYISVLLIYSKGNKFNKLFLLRDGNLLPEVIIESF